MGKKKEEKNRVRESGSTGTEGRSVEELMLGFDDRFQKLVEEIRDCLPEGGLAVDIGCGEGKIWQVLQDQKVVGVDVSFNNLKSSQKNIRVVNGSGERLPIKSGCADLVLVSEVLEHVYYPERVMEEIERVLKVKGRAIITFPNTSSLSFRLGMFLWGRIPSLNYPGNVGHIRFFDLLGFKQMLSGIKLEIVKIRGVGCFSFSRENFGIYIPVPRRLRVIAGDLFPRISSGCLVVLEKGN